MVLTNEDRIDRDLCGVGWVGSRVSSTQPVASDGRCFDAADAINEGEVTWGDGPGGYYGAMVDHVPLDAWIANRAAGVGTKNGDDE